jgi:hypothetical protein
LIEAAPPFSPGVQRHRQDQIEAIFFHPSERCCQQLSQRPGQRQKPIEFEALNQPPQDAVVPAETAGLVECKCAATAQATQNGVAERRPLQEVAAARALGAVVR